MTAKVENYCAQKFTKNVPVEYRGKGMPELHLVRAILPAKPGECICLGAHLHGALPAAGQAARGAVPVLQGF